MTARPNDVFDCDGVLHRVLRASSQPGHAWCIELDSRKALPVEWSVTHIALLPIVEVPHAVSTARSLVDKAAKERAWNILGRFVSQTPFQNLMQPTLRKAAISEYIALLKDEAETAKKLGGSKATCSEPTLYKYLRRYWQGGQTPAALYPDQSLSKQTAREDDFTAKRGRPNPRGLGIYQLKKRDCDNMRWAIRTFRARDGERKSLAVTHLRLIEKHYSFLDGNGKKTLMKEGQYPSYAQLRYFYEKNFDRGTRTKHKVGEDIANMNYRVQFGSALSDTHGPGERFEIDATPLECTAVTNTRKKRLVGKPTLYLIIDRWSRLIVGYYLGFEYESWIGAAMAILSLSESKEEWCQKYDVVYDQSDWPAHSAYSMEFWVDRGSAWTAKASKQIVEDLGTTLNILPPRRPELKPFVENLHGLVLGKLRAFEESSDPDANQKRRQKRKYKYNAASTIDRLNKYIIEIIISLNRTVFDDYPRSADMIADELLPSPINLWNYGVRRTGLPPRLRYDDVKLALLPRATARVNEHGIHYRKCSYYSKPLHEAGWLDQGLRNTFDADISYDPRRTDNIYVFPRVGRGGKPHVAHLSSRSSQFAGMSFSERDTFEDLTSEMRGTAAHLNREEGVRLLSIVDPLAKQDLEDMRAATRGDSMASRTKHAKQDRLDALNDERDSTMLITEEPSGKRAKSTSATRVELPCTPRLKVVSSGKDETLASASNAAALSGPIPDRVQEKIDAMRRKMQSDSTPSKDEI